MKLLTQFRYRNRWVILLWSLVALFTLSMGTFVSTSKDTMPIAIESREAQDLVVGDFVSVSSFIPLTDFAYEQVGDIEYTYFLVALSDVNDAMFLAGWRASPEDAEIIWERYNETEEAVWILDLDYYGRIEALPNEASDYFDEGLQASGYDGTLPVMRLVLHANAGTYVPDSTDNLFFGGILLVLGALLGVYPVLILTGVTQRHVWRSAQRLSMGGSAKEWLNDFAEKATYLSGTYITPDAILYDNDGITKLVPANDVVWAYGHQQRHRLYFVITIKTTHSVVLRTADKKTYRIVCRSKEQANVIFEGLQDLLPHVILGYNSSLEKLYQRSPAGFITSVNDATA